METAQSWLLLAVIMAGVMFTTNGAPSSSCPNHVNQVAQGYTAVHNDVCYLFVNKELYWGKARDACWDHGGEMLTIENNETTKFIKKTLDSRELTWDKNGVWLGAKQKSGTWRWANGKAVKYSNWAENQPKTFLGRTFLDCVVMRHEDGWKWYNSACSFAKFHYNYICQFPLNKQGSLPRIVATDQAEDSRNSPILAIIAGITVSILFVVFVIFLALFLHRRHRKQNPIQAVAHFNDNVYHRPSVRSSHPIYQAPSLFRNEAPFSSNDDLYMTPSEVLNPNDLHNEANSSYSFIQTRACNCMNQSPDIIPEFEALSNFGPKLEQQLPLMADLGKTAPEVARARGTTKECQNCHYSSKNQGDYVDMSIHGLMGKGKCSRLENNKHIYSNVYHQSINQ